VQRSLILWLAQGFGAGRVPFAPGTFGSFVGLLWLAVLLSACNPWGFILGNVMGVFASVWACGKAEEILKQKDPGSVVLDEIVALPLCFVAAIVWQAMKTQAWPDAMFFFSGTRVWFTLGVFVAFRLFDIAKPWPVRQSQSLPGGWGVTVDDLLAAVYVNLVTLAWLGWWGL
jgi:phosphatidylglycerophosphatase A